MRRVTIEDVAREAGVSRQTISRVINNKGDISPKTRSDVLEVIQRLGYRPNRLAQSMITQRTYTIGVEVVDITNPVFAEMVRGIQDIAAERGYNIFLTNSNDDPALAIHSLSMLVTQGVDGLIAMFPNAADSDVLAFADQYRPIVVINRSVSHPNIHTVSVDIYAGGVLALEHLIAHGHTAIGIMTNPTHPHNQERRLRAYRDTLQRHGIEVNPAWIIPAAPTLQGGYHAAHHLLTLPSPPTAIFGYNDLMSIGALRACQELGVSVPENCAIVGFDDIPIAAMVSPSLTTIHSDPYAIGQRAILRLLEVIAEPEGAFPPVELPVELVQRESTK